MSYDSRLETRHKPWTSLILGTALATDPQHSDRKKYGRLEQANRFADGQYSRTVQGSLFL